MQYLFKKKLGKVIYANNSYYQIYLRSVLFNKLKENHLQHKEHSEITKIVFNIEFHSQMATTCTENESISIILQNYHIYFVNILP